MPENKNSYSISELSREFQVTTRTIRHYEEIGLLSPQRRGQTRIYTPADRVRLKLILRGKRLGLSLDESRDIINMYEPGKGNKGQLQKLIAAIGQQRQKLEQQQKDIANMIADLNRAESDCLQALRASGQ